MAALGLGQGAAVRRALAAMGITVAGIRWQWAPGAKGQAYDPHLARDGVAVYNPDGFVGEPEYGMIPGDGLSPNSRYCRCGYRMILRGTSGRFLPEEPVAYTERTTNG